jgi:hypothetical protein
VLLKKVHNLIAIAIIVVGAMFVYDVWNRWSFAGHAPITAGLSDDNDEANRQFAQRVSDRFPIGSSKANLVRVLSEQGFERPQNLHCLATSNPTSPCGSGQFLMLSVSHGVIRRCTRIWHVRWDADETGALTAINAGFLGMCPYF